MELFDTHCHVHFADYKIDVQQVSKNSLAAGVKYQMLVGCTLEDSNAAFDYAKKTGDLKSYISIGLHPHEGSVYAGDELALAEFSELAARHEVVAIGETGLDYYYNHSDRITQEKLFRFQLDLAAKHDLPLIFHVRSAFTEFFEILDTYQNIRGVVHCFSSGEAELHEILKRGLYVGLNGIMTFTHDQRQLAAAKKVPLDRLLLETDSPYLTPKPFRGTICEPKHVAVTAEFLASLRGEKLEDLVATTTANAIKLFKL